MTVYPKNLYFAHSLLDFDTDNSRRALGVLAHHCKRSVIHNPEDHPNKVRDLAESMGWEKAYEAILHKLVGTDGGMVVLEHGDSVGKGVHTEISIALDELDIPVWVIRPNGLFPLRDVYVHDEGDWKVHYGKVILDLAAYVRLPGQSYGTALPPSGKGKAACRCN